VPRLDLLTDYLAGLRRRREASYRLPPLDCGCRDPWPCRCYEPPPSDHQLDGWVATIVHLADHGLQGIVPVSVRRALKERDAA
jgi:hypothetical protein